MSFECPDGGYKSCNDSYIICSAFLWLELLFELQRGDSFAERVLNDEWLGPYPSGRISRPFLDGQDGSGVR